MSVIQRHRSVSRGAILALILLYAGCRDAGQSPIQPSIDPAVYTRELLAREITVRARHHTAETAWNEGRFDEAIVILRGILELDPIHPLAFQGLVQVQARRGDLEAAGPLLDSFAGVDSPGIHYGSGLLQLFSGGNDEAHAQIEMARDGYAEARHPSGYAASETDKKTKDGVSSRYA